MTTNRSEGMTEIRDLFMLSNYESRAVAFADGYGKLLLYTPAFGALIASEPEILAMISDAVCNGSTRVKCEHALLSITKSTSNVNGTPITIEADRSPAYPATHCYKVLADAASELLITTDSEGKLCFTNKASRQYLASLEQDLANITSLFQDTALANTFLARLAGGKPLTDEVAALRGGGDSEIISTISAETIESDGNTFFIWRIRDITGQSEHEQALRAKNEQLAKVNNQMEKFLYSTSHDLRAPIASILGLINLLRIETRDQAINHYVSKIESSALKLDKIIKDILSFSHATYQRITSEKIEFDLFIWNIMNQHLSDPALKKVKCEVKAECAYPFYSDPGRLEIILDNIIRNALHFHDVNKYRSFIKVSVTTTAEKATIEIIDNGIGIGKNHIESVFNMFYKASHHSRGAGLGLFIVKETLQALGGTISMQSEIGFGTAVQLEIPNHHKGKLISRKLQLQSQASSKERLT